MPITCTAIDWREREQLPLFKFQWTDFKTNLPDTYLILFFCSLIIIGQWKEREIIDDRLALHKGNYTRLIESRIYVWIWTLFDMLCNNLVDEIGFFGEVFLHLIRNENFYWCQFNFDLIIGLEEKSVNDIVLSLSPPSVSLCPLFSSNKQTKNVINCPPVSLSSWLLLLIEKKKESKFFDLYTHVDSTYICICTYTYVCVRGSDERCSSSGSVEKDKLFFSSLSLSLYSLANMYEMPSFSFLPFGFYCSVEYVICIAVYTYGRKRIFFFYPVGLHNFLFLAGSFSVRKKERKKEREREKEEISSIPSSFLLYICCYTDDLFSDHRDRLFMRFS